MYPDIEITEVFGREILDSRGNPTVEVDVTVASKNCNEKYLGRASVPSGASTGQFEAVELRDGEKRFDGLGVQKAVRNINGKMNEVLVGKSPFDQRAIDKLLLVTDGTQNKSEMGANAVLGVSMAVARAAAASLHIPLYRYLGGMMPLYMPVPMMNILNGGKHADNTVDIQEFMIMPIGAVSFSRAMRTGVEIYHSLKKICKSRGLSTAVGDEGGFAPNVDSASDVLRLIVEAVEESGYKIGSEVGIALDVAASEMYDKETGRYYFEGESKVRGEKVYRSTDEMLNYLSDLVEHFPILSIEDGLSDVDTEGWKKLTQKLGQKIQLVGDDLFVTNPSRISEGIQEGIANAVLVKVNQIGTLTETFDAIEIAHKGGYRTIISHRSGETEDAIIADIALAVNAGQIKTGAPCRAERTAKYNQLLRIEEELKDTVKYKEFRK